MCAVFVSLLKNRHLFCVHSETQRYPGTAVLSLKESQVMCLKHHLAEPMSLSEKWPNIPIQVRVFIFKSV